MLIATTMPSLASPVDTTYSSLGYGRKDLSDDRPTDDAPVSPKSQSLPVSPTTNMKELDSSFTSSMLDENFFIPLVADNVAPDLTEDAEVTDNLVSPIRAVDDRTIEQSPQDYTFVDVPHIAGTAEPITHSNGGNTVSSYPAVVSVPTPIPPFPSSPASKTICHSHFTGSCTVPTCMQRHFLHETEISALLHYADISVTPGLDICQRLLRGTCTMRCQLRHYLYEDELRLVTEVRRSQLSAHSNNNTSSSPSSFHPTTPHLSNSPPICMFFASGKCQNGSSCSFQHEGNIPITKIQCIYYAQGKCSKGSLCRYIHTDPVSTGAMPAVEVEFSYSDPSIPQCSFFLANKCRNGSSCRYLHDIPKGPSTNLPCRYFQTGQCIRGQNCPFFHDNSKTVCTFYSRFGNCKNGDKCSFFHEIAADSSMSAENTDPSDTVDDTNITAWDTPYVNTWDSNAETDGWSGGRSTGDLDCASDNVGKNTDDGDDVLGWGGEHVGQTDWADEVNASIECLPHDTTNIVEPDPSPSLLASDLTSATTGGSRTSKDASLQNTLPEEEDPWADKENIDVDPVDDEGLDVDPQLQAENAASWKISGDGWGDESAEPSYPRRVHEPCIYFGQGNCARGSKCRFLHLRSNGLGDIRDPPDSSQIYPEEDEADLATTDSQVEDPVDNSSVFATFFYCTAQFGEGGAIQSLNTVYDSSTILLSNLPPETTRPDVEGLCEAFGNVEQVSVTNDISEVTFSSPEESKHACLQLQNISFKGQNLTVQLSLPGHAAIINDLHPQSRTVCIKWPIASRMAWVYYNSMTEAKSSVEKLNGKLYGGRAVKVTLAPRQKPNGQGKLFAVGIDNLPAQAAQEGIKVFSGAEVVSMCPPTYSKSPLENICSLLKQKNGQKPIHLDVAKNDSAESKAVAFAQFSTSEQARDAVSTLNKQPQTFLGGSCLLLKTVASSSYITEVSALKSILPGLSSLIETANSDSNETRILHYEIDSTHARIRVIGAEEQLAHFLRTEIAVERYIRGDIMLNDNGDVVWDDFFDSLSFLELLARSNESRQYYISCDLRNQHLRVFGDSEKAKKWMDKLLRKINSDANLSDVTLSSPEMYGLLHGAIDYLASNNIKIGHKLVLDLVNRKITIRGGSAIVDEVKETLARFSSPYISDDGCALCLHQPISPIRLSCQHRYCQECFRLLLQSFMKARFGGLPCAADSCSCQIPFSAVKKVLTEAEVQDLLECSFMSYVRAHPDELNFCPASPHCQSVYRPGSPGTVAVCPSCLSWICTSCHVEFHENANCEVRREMQNMPLLV